MITAYNNTTQSAIRVDNLINKGQYFGETYLLGIGCGFDTHTFAIEASCEQDALEVFVDSKYGHLVIIENADLKDYDEDYISYYGNEGKPCDLDNVRILEKVTLNYFAKNN